MEEAVRIPGAKSGSPPQKWAEYQEATQGGYERGARSAPCQHGDC